MNRARLPDFLALCALLLAPCLLLWRVAFGGDVFLPADLLRDIAPWAKPGAPPFTPWNPLHWDGIAEFYPWRLFAAQSERAGWLPLWNPHQFCGTPFLANAQSAVLYPLNLLFVLLPVKAAFGASVLLHLFLTGTFLYAFLRWGSFRLTRAAALTGALCWQLSAWQVAWLALPTFLCTSAWLPLALLLTERAAQKPTPGRGAALGAVLGVTLLAGHLQIAFYCVGLTAAYACFCVARQVRVGTVKLSAFAGATVAAVLIMAGIALPQLLPSVELSRVSHRAGGHPTLDGYAGYVKLAVPAINLVTLWLPQFFGNPTAGTYWGLGTNGGPSAYMENAASVGALALLLAFAGVMGAWKASAPMRFFAIAGVVALLLALGTPLNAVLYFGVPGWAQSGSPGRVLVLWTLCASVLAAVGVEQVLPRLRHTQPPLPQRNGLKDNPSAPPSLQGFASERGKGDGGLGLLPAILAWAVLLALSLAYTAFWVAQNAPAGALAVNLSSVGDWGRAPVGIVLAGMAVLVLAGRGSLTPKSAGVVLAILVAAEGLASGIGFNRTARAADVYPVTSAIAFLQAHAAEGRVMPINRRWSLDGAHPPPAVLPPNAATVYGLYDTQGYDSLLTGRYFAWAGTLDGGSPAPPENGNMVFTDGVHSPLVQEAGVKYVVSRGPLPSPTLLLVLQDGETFVYKNRDALPRVAITGYKMNTPSQPPLLTETAPTRLSVTVNGNFVSPAMLSVADQWYPGWQAQINGEPASVELDGDIFRKVQVLPAAAHQELMMIGRPGPLHITIRYTPTAFRVGLYGMALALLTLTALGAASIAGHVSGRGRQG